MSKHHDLPSFIWAELLLGPYRAPQYMCVVPPWLVSLMSGGLFRAIKPVPLARDERVKGTSQKSPEEGPCLLQEVTG
ncbi:MAG TPA: hypothetical protein VIL30_04840 [Ramlibacter sp.]